MTQATNLCLPLIVKTDLVWLFFSIQLPYYILWHFEKISLPLRPFTELTWLSEDSFCDKLCWKKQASHEVTTWQSQFYHHPLPPCLTARQYPAYPPPYPRRSHPAQPWRGLWCPANLIAKRFRAPEGGYILSSLREERLGEKGGAFFNGKEGRDDFRNSY